MGLRLVVWFVITWLFGIGCGFYIARGFYLRPQENGMGMPLVAALLDDTRKEIDE